MSLTASISLGFIFAKKSHFNAKFTKKNLFKGEAVPTDPHGKDKKRFSCHKKDFDNILLFQSSLLNATDVFTLYCTTLQKH